MGFWCALYGYFNDLTGFWWFFLCSSYFLIKHLQFPWWIVFSSFLWHLSLLLCPFFSTQGGKVQPGSTSPSDTDVFTDEAETLRRPIFRHPLKLFWMRAAAIMWISHAWSLGTLSGPLWNIFSNDEMLLLLVSDIQSLSVSLLTGLVIQASLGTSARGESFDQGQMDQVPLLSCA